MLGVVVVALPKSNQYNTIIRIKVESVKKNWNFKCIDWPQNLKSKSKAQIIQSNKYPMKTLKKSLLFTEKRCC